MLCVRAIGVGSMYSNGSHSKHDTTSFFVLVATRSGNGFAKSWFHVWGPLNKEGF